MAKYGWPRKFIAMISQFHDGMLARVQDRGETSAVSNGVKQGCVLALTLVNLISAMLTELNGGIGMRYRYDESLFIFRRPQARTKVLTDTINVFLFVMSAPSTLTPKRTNNKGLTSSMMPATTLGSQSAP